jgi:hypothetical protein
MLHMPPPHTHTHTLHLCLLWQLVFSAEDSPAAATRTKLKPTLPDDDTIRMTLAQFDPKTLLMALYRLRSGQWLRTLLTGRTLAESTANDLLIKRYALAFC